ncbi:MAG: lysophospholipid acyltransferase family protein [Deltaproteobacteria bacterium]|nr:lysophospholipid acyltransferase family protein [Deltaproteobacteria bacterium]MBW2128968.1 lysophospholipid acyltransferase family protein [Deltaproteobacteria bacterium]MBW2302937.1 lysophospholipid acyltransferase family protein [Deltaproteobacteria bacterium]
MIVYRLLSILIHGMALIPLPVGRVLGKGLGRLFPILPTSRTSIVLENIRRAFPGTEWAKNPKKLLRKVYLHFGQMLFEVPHILRMNPANMDRYVLFEGKEILERVLAKGKGCFLLTAHFGNWEMMSAAVTLLFPRLAIVVRPIDFAPLDRLISEIRTRFGTEIIPKRKAMRQVLKAIKEKKNVGILLDQNVDWYEGVFVDFLGRRACTNKGLARLALKTGAPVVPVFSVRQGDGRIKIIFEPELTPIKSGDKTRDVEEATIRFTKVIENYIRKHPDHWFWFHRRWKTRPYCRIPESKGYSTFPPARGMGGG